MKKQNALYNRAIEILKEFHPDLESRLVAAASYIKFFDQPGTKFNKKKFLKSLED